MKESILIVEDEFVEANHIRDILERGGYMVMGTARSVNVALEMLEKNTPSLVILDILLEGQLTGIHLGNTLKGKGIAFLYLSANSNRETLELAKTTTPYGFLVKPFRRKDLLIAIEIALYHHQERLKLDMSKAVSGNRTKPGAGSTAHDKTMGQIVGQSKKLVAILEDVRVVASTDTSVLLLGETGTGKELIANTIHELSQRAKGPLVKVNCAAIPEGLIESTLFGHEAGAFTGAINTKRGKFEQAERGTIFLDEIGEMSMDTQAKLLRVLQTKEVEPLGSENTVKVNCRVIAATNRDLEAEVATGRFRMDLYYRLTVFPVMVPPLRERSDDIPALVNHFLSKYGKQLGKTELKMDAAVLAKLVKYDWPGNIRQLENVIERTVLITKGDTIKEILLPDATTKAKRPADTTVTLQDNEREHIVEVLRKCQGRVYGKGGAAELLNMNASTLNSRIKKLGIRKQKNIY